MPAVSRKQQQAMAIAEHHPEKLYSKNKGMLKMSKQQLSDYASTKSSSINKASRKIQEARAQNSY